MCLPGYRTLSDLTDEELIEVFQMYEVGELLSTEEQIDYVMARLPDYFSGRPKLVSYDITDAAREFFKKLEEEAKAEGLDLSLGFDDEF